MAQIPDQERWKLLSSKEIGRTISAGSDFVGSRTGNSLLGRFHED
jgi:hypothetical protein